MSEIWAYIAHKNGITKGVCSPEVGKRSLKEFLSDFAADGYTLTPVASREEFIKFTDHTPMC